MGDRLRLGCVVQKALSGRGGGNLRCCVAKNIYLQVWPFRDEWFSSLRLQRPPGFSLLHTSAGTPTESPVLSRRPDAGTAAADVEQSSGILSWHRSSRTDPRTQRRASAVRTLCSIWGGGFPEFSHRGDGQRQTTTTEEGALKWRLGEHQYSNSSQVMEQAIGSPCRLMLLLMSCDYAWFLATNSVEETVLLMWRG